MGLIRILFLADTHLGFDYPFRPRIIRRRRGTDFFRNYENALRDACNKGIDLIVHGGDIFYRSRIPSKLTEMVFSPLRRIADTGIPVFIVPGNHERAHIPHGDLVSHGNIFIFSEPRNYILRINGITLALAGFPFIRNDIRMKFRWILEKTGWKDKPADIRLLCLHQSVDGATVGPSDYTFRYAEDVIDINEIPQEFSLVLAGHIHRHQVLTRNLKGNGIKTPVLYPGAIERTSFAEKNETKGYMTVELEPGRKPAWSFHPLESSPMFKLYIDASELSGGSFIEMIEAEVKQLPHDSIIKILVYGEISSEVIKSMRAESMRRVIPESMHATIRIYDDKGSF